MRLVCLTQRPAFTLRASHVAPVRHPQRHTSNALHCHRLAQPHLWSAHFASKSRCGDDARSAVASDADRHASFSVYCSPLLWPPVQYVCCAVPRWIRLDALTVQHSSMTGCSNLATQGSRLARSGAHIYPCILRHGCRAQQLQTSTTRKHTV
jgi:hypothetical protein